MGEGAYSQTENHPHDAGLQHDPFDWHPTHMPTYPNRLSIPKKLVRSQRISAVFPRNSQVAPRRARGAAAIPRRRPVPAGGPVSALPSTRP